MRVIIGLVVFVLFGGCGIYTRQSVDLSCEKGEVYLKFYEVHRAPFNGAYKTDKNLKWSGFYEDDNRKRMKCMED